MHWWTERVMESLKSLGLPNKISSCEVSVLKVNKTVQHDKNLILGWFKDYYYSSLAENRLKKLHTPPTKFTLDIVFQHYTELCNLSITSGIFPDSCKIVKLKPIYKNGSLTEASNYRPVSLLPLISQVIEKVIHDQISAFVKSRNLLYNYQSGFRKNHSTDYCLSFLNDKILKGFDQGLITGMILIYKKPLIQSTMTFHCKNCMLLVSLNIQ